MVYIAPIPANFTFIDGAYVFPTPLQFSYSVGTFSVGFSVASPTTYHRHREKVTDVILGIHAQAITNRHHQFAGSATIGFQQDSAHTGTSNPGGRLVLIAVTQYAPPPGDEVNLYVATGNFLWANETRPTVAATASLQGAAIYTNEEPPTFAATASITGSYAFVQQADDTVAITGSLSGSVAFVQEPAPTFFATGGMQATMGLVAELQQPYATWFIGGSENGLYGSWTFSPPTMQGEIDNAVFFGIVSELQQPSMFGSMALIDSWLLDALCQQPTMSGVISANGVLEILADAQQPEMDGEILAGDVWHIYGEIPQPKLRGSIVPIEETGWLIDSELQQPTMSGLINPAFNLVAELQFPETIRMVISEPSYWSLDAQQPTMVGSISSGLILAAELQQPSMVAEIGPIGLMSNGWEIPKLTFKGHISGGSDIFLLAEMQQPELTLTIYQTNSFSIVSDLAQPAMKGKISLAPTIQLNVTLQQPTMSGGDIVKEELGFANQIPPITMDARINSPSMDFV